jgi:hypothetical protein
MTRGPWLMVLSLPIAVAITHVSLWMRNIRPSRKISLWEHLIWEPPSKDEQTKEYYRQRLLTGIVVLPLTVLVLYALTEFYGR